MHGMIDKLNIYVLPPVLSLIIGLALAILSLAKGRVNGRWRTENLLFAITCIWWSCLLPPAFICHQLFRGDVELILKIERVIHFFYDYLPLVTLVYIHKIFQVKRNWLVILTAVVCAAISLTTQTELYFKGMYTYSWGYIAKGGIAFDIFGLFGTIMLIYGIVISIKKFRSEPNRIARRKIKYISISIMASAALTLLNIPAINGIDFYPMGNFNFLALGILAYGVMRYRFMDIRTVLHITLIWLVMSSLILIPNYQIFLWFKQYAASLSNQLLFVISAVWLGANILYVSRVQPRIDQAFNRRKFDLIAEEHKFINEISRLQSFPKLAAKLTGVMQKAMVFTGAEFIIPADESGGGPLKGATYKRVPVEVSGWFVLNNNLTERTMVETNPSYSGMRGPLLSFFDELECDYIAPFVNNGELIGLLKLKERKNLRQLDPADTDFIDNICSAASNALANSIMYQHLSDLKDNLENKVRERTVELQNAMQTLSKSHADLQAALARIQELAIRDELTGLYNRRQFMEFLALEKNRADRKGQLFSLIMMDIDFFKHVNDTHGHVAGDQVLKVVSTVTQKALRSIDFCGRYGGEEFVVVLGETTREGAMTAAERIRSLIEATRFPGMGDEFRITISLGVTEYKFNEDTSKTIKRADDALYQAKKGGRNRIDYME
jgi:diguanylate cyclase (GGDEF)-like protein